MVTKAIVITIATVAVATGVWLLTTDNMNTAVHQCEGKNMQTAWKNDHEIECLPRDAKAK